MWRECIDEEFVEGLAGPEPQIPDLCTHKACFRIQSTSTKGQGTGQDRAAAEKNGKNFSLRTGIGHVNSIRKKKWAELFAKKAGVTALPAGRQEKTKVVTAAPGATGRKQPSNSKTNHEWGAPSLEERTCNWAKVFRAEQQSRGTREMIVEGSKFIAPVGISAHTNPKAKAGNASTYIMAIARITHDGRLLKRSRQVTVENGDVAGAIAKATTALHELQGELAALVTGPRQALEAAFHSKDQESGSPWPTHGKRRSAKICGKEIDLPHGIMAGKHPTSGRPMLIMILQGPDKLGNRRVLRRNATVTPATLDARMEELTAARSSFYQHMADPATEEASKFWSQLSTRNKTIRFMGCDLNVPPGIIATTNSGGRPELRINLVKKDATGVKRILRRSIMKGDPERRLDELLAARRAFLLRFGFTDTWTPNPQSTAIKKKGGKKKRIVSTKHRRSHDDRQRRPARHLHPSHREYSTPGSPENWCADD